MDEPIQILCVDDEKNVLRAIERVFLDDDYVIHTARSADEGIEILKDKSPIQIVISDYRMPGTNGVDFLRDVCENWPDTVRIVLSGYADMVAVVSAINEGQIYKFIPKPWNDDELRITLSNALERYFLHKKNAQLADELKKRNDELREINQNLERLIEERTSELRFQNRVLTHSQNILNSLPVGVLGIESDGLIVQCNREGTRLLTGDGTSVIGRYATELIPERLAPFIERVRERGAFSEAFAVRDVRLNVRGVFMEYPDGQCGMVLILDNGVGHG